MAVILGIFDLEPFGIAGDDTRALAEIEDALAVAARVAPCLSSSEDEGVLAAARAILRGAVRRRLEAGSGAFSQQSAGPFQVSMDTRQPSRALFTAAEVKQLQSLCAGAAGVSYTVSLV